MTPDYSPGLIEALQAQYPLLSVEEIAAGVIQWAKVPDAALRSACRSAETVRLARLAADPLYQDRIDFKRLYPNASRYYDPEEREALSKAYPGWSPGCDLSALIASQQANHETSQPHWMEPAQIRSLIHSEVRKLALTKSLGAKKHSDACTCEICFAPWHSWALSHAEPPKTPEKP